MKIDAFEKRKKAVADEIETKREELKSFRDRNNLSTISRGNVTNTNLFGSMESTIDCLRATQIKTAKFSDHISSGSLSDALIMQKLNDVFYISDEPRLKNITGTQFIIDRYTRMSKAYFLQISQDGSSEILDNQSSQDQSVFEDFKGLIDDSNETEDLYIKRLKFEK